MALDNPIFSIVLSSKSIRSGRKSRGQTNVFGFWPRGKAGRGRTRRPRTVKTGRGPRKGHAGTAVNIYDYIVIVINGP